MDAVAGRVGDVESDHLSNDEGDRFGFELPSITRATAAAKVTTVLARLKQGNFSRVKGVGAGVFESMIDFGPGY